MFAVSGLTYYSFRIQSPLEGEIALYTPKQPNKRGEAHDEPFLPLRESTLKRVRCRR